MLRPKLRNFGIHSEKGRSAGPDTLIIVDAGSGGISPVDLIAEAVCRQECILFLGAGVHAPPPDGSPYSWPVEHRPALGRELSSKLAQQCGLAERYPDEEPTNLARVASFYENKFSRHRLVQTIAQEVHRDRRPSPMLNALAELDFPLVVTTNYEGLFEESLHNAGKKPRVAVYTPERIATEDPSRPTPESPIVRKLYGDISRPETIVVTDEDFMEFSMRMTDKAPYEPVPIRLKARLMEWPTLFVGYSMRDYNMKLLITTLYWKIDRANRPEMYSVDVSPDPLILEIWDGKLRYLSVIAEDVWEFVPKLYERVLGKELSR